MKLQPQIWTSWLCPCSAAKVAIRQKARSRFAIPTAQPSLFPSLPPSLPAIFSFGVNSNSPQNVAVFPPLLESWLSSHGVSLATVAKVMFCASVRLSQPRPPFKRRNFMFQARYFSPWLLLEALSSVCISNLSALKNNFGNPPVNDNICSPNLQTCHLCPPKSLALSRTATRCRKNLPAAAAPHPIVAIAVRLLPTRTLFITFASTTRRLLKRQRMIDKLKREKKSSGYSPMSLRWS